MNADERREARRTMRARRRALDPATRAAAAASVAAHLASLGLPRPGSRIAAYWPIDGELDPLPLLRLARNRGCEILLPVITDWRHRRMRFAPLGDRELVQGRRIVEPACTAAEWRDPRWLDLVLLPCVAFDAAGTRLGMGAGFYDRALGFLLRRTAWLRPRLLGIAYDFQRLPVIGREPWDVPLWGVVTDAAVHGAAAAHVRHSPEDPK